jgi:hypothetical protein
MPNWCANSVVLKHKDPTFIARARQAAEKDGLLNEFIPVPKDLKETISGYMGDEEEQKQLEIQQAYNLKHYGYANWYDFCVNEWGTKWDVTGEVEDYDDDGIQIYFDSAWAPPIGAYEKLKSMGFEIEANYYEPGCAFVGEWLDGEDFCYQIEGNSEWVRENIPEHLDDAYSISESMEQWEEETNDEEN